MEPKTTPRNTCLYGLAHTKTFRRSSRKFWDIYGGNLQNIEKSVRRIYIPDGFGEHVKQKCKYWLDTGDLSVFTEEELMTIRCFGQIDQAGAEALIVAYLCRAGAYRQLFENSVKPHVYVAMKLFKDIWTKKMKDMGGMIEDFDIDAISVTPIPELKKNPFWRDLDLLIKQSDNWSLQERYYYLAKQTCHSGNYGIMENTFVMNILEKSGGKIALPKEKGREFLMEYRGLFPEIPEWNRDVLTQVEKTGMLYNALGFPYQITDYVGDHKVVEANAKEYIAWGPQSTVGEITRLAVSQMQEYIETERKPWDNLADTHDSMMTQFPLMDVREWISKASQFMNIEMTSPADGVKFRMKSECNIGFNWSSHDEMKPEKNPLGLQSPKWLNN